MDSKKAKILSNLLISGTALIAFGILDVAKFVLSWIIDPVQFEFLKLIFAENQNLGFIIVGLVLGVLVVEVLLYILIGFSARAESKGKKKSLFYVVVAIILGLFLFCASIYILVLSIVENYGLLSILDAIISFALTLVVVYILIDIVVSSFKNRKLKKQQKLANNDVLEIKNHKKSKKEAKN